MLFLSMILGKNTGRAFLMRMNRAAPGKNAGTATIWRDEGDFTHDVLVLDAEKTWKNPVSRTIHGLF